MRALLPLALALLSWALASPEAARQAVERWLRGEVSPSLGEVLKAPPEEAPRLLERYALFPPPPGLSVNLESPRVEGERVFFPASVGEEVGEVVVVLEGGEARRVYFRSQALALPPTSSPPWRAWGLSSSPWFGPPCSSTLPPSGPGSWRPWPSSGGRGGFTS